MIIIKLKQRMAISIGVGLLISIRWILLDKRLADKPLDLETAIGLVIIAHSCWVLLTIRSFESRAEKGEGGKVRKPMGAPTCFVMTQPAKSPPPLTVRRMWLRRPEDLRHLESM